MLFLCPHLAPATLSSSSRDRASANWPDTSLLSEQGGSHRRGVAEQHKETEIPMSAKKSRSARQDRSSRQPKVKTIIEEVDNLKDLAPRMLELIETEPEGTRIYLRVRKNLTIN
jgi:hypothetical protein